MNAKNQSAAKSHAPAPEVIVRLELTPIAKRHLNQIAGQKGMTRTAVTSRLLEWFAVQNEMLQALILGHYPKEIQAEIALVILKRLGFDRNQASASKARKAKASR